jgi:hypothetical protein
MLDGPISVALATRLWDVTRGNPLFLRELLWTSRIDETVVRNPHYWDLHGVIAASGRVQDLVRRRFGELDPAARRCLAAVAIADPIDVETLTSVAPMGVLSELERQQLIEIDDQAGEAVVRMARSLLVAGVAGDFGTALELGGRLVDADLPPSAAGPVLMAYTLALSMTGKVDGAIELLDRGDALADDDVDAIASEFGAAVSEQPWAREVELTDPDGNRLRIGTRPVPG